VRILRYEGIEQSLKLCVFETLLRRASFCITSESLVGAYTIFGVDGSEVDPKVRTDLMAV
jgi:hypothetical protein